NVMVNGRSEGKTSSIVRGAERDENLNLYSGGSEQQRKGEGSSERSVMEAGEGRGFSSDLYRNTSEEMFIKSLMESSIGMPAPTMEMLGFKNLHHNFRTDSEELFKSWLTTGTGEASTKKDLYFNHGYGTPSIAHRTRQSSKRMSTEISNLSGQQQGQASMQKKRSTDVLSTQHNHPTADDVSNRQSNNKGAVDRNMQASNLYMAKAWFQSSQPMTRSRSSELRRRYVAMQTTGENDESGLPKQEFSNPSGLGSDLLMHDVTNQFGTFNTPHTGNMDNVSSVVSMLKGTLERKKQLGNHETAEEDSSNSIYHHCHGQEVLMMNSFNQGNGDGMDSLQALASAIAKNPMSAGLLETVQEVVDFEMEGYANHPVNPMQTNTISREPSSLSESSAAAPVVSSGFDACDGPSNSSQNVTTCESSKKAVGNGSEQGGRAKEFRGRIIDNLKDDKKWTQETQPRSVGWSALASNFPFRIRLSVLSFKQGSDTVKSVNGIGRMAEAKERNLTPVVPSDMQSVMKRCENLEKEVRSLKLNLSFMNRKDSEQTKQIEELQKRNEDLTDEKERLLEEIERIMSETGKV
ncbi:unnamed protein product, partial [Linum tenue]